MNLINNWKFTFFLLFIALIVLIFSTLDSHTSLSTGALLFDLSKTSIKQLIIQNGNKIFDLNKINDIWMLNSDRANPSTISILLKNISELRVLDKLDQHELKGNNSMKQLGLDNPTRFITLVSNKKATIYFGKFAVGKDQVYIKINSEPTIYLVQQDIINWNILESLEDHKITNLSENNLREVIVSNFDHAPIFHIKKREDIWYIEYPIHSLGDQQKIEHWIQSIIGLSIQKVAKIVDILYNQKILTYILNGSSTVEIACFFNQISHHEYLSSTDRVGFLSVHNFPLFAPNPLFFCSKKIRQIDWKEVDTIEIMRNNSSMILQRKKNEDAWTDQYQRTITEDSMQKWFKNLQNISLQPLNVSEKINPSQCKSLAHIRFLTNIQSINPNINTITRRTLAEYKISSYNQEIYIEEIGKLDMSLVRFDQKDIINSILSAWSNEEEKKIKNYQ